VDLRTSKRGIIFLKRMSSIACWETLMQKFGGFVLSLAIETKFYP
jgi:hypothetical protein